MSLPLCDECKKKLGPNAVAILVLDEEDEKVVLFAANMTHELLSKLDIKIENYGFNRIGRVKDTLDHRLIRPLNNERMKRGENSLL